MNCRNCNSDKLEVFHDQIWSVEDGNVYKCLECDLIFIDCIMNDDEEKKFYENYNKHVKQRGVIVEKSIEEFHEKSINLANERLKVVRKFFERKKVLEIGSATGAFLSLLDGCNTYACELTTDNLIFSKQFINGEAYNSIDDIKNNKFDVICMYHVFEHIKKPRDFLETCKKLLNKTGKIVIEVPHSEDPLITIFDSKEFKDFVFQPMHPMVYNEKSLDYIFNECGFKKDEVIFHQRYGLDNHLSWLKNKRPGGDPFLKKIFEDDIFYKKKLQDIKRTDTIFYVAKLA